MENERKVAVLVFPHGQQGQIWAAILRSQNISVIWESPDVNLHRTLSVLKRQQHLPDLLMIDTRLRQMRPYHLCRWHRTSCPSLNLLLVNGAQLGVTQRERQWAVAQGAADLLPRFDPESLARSAAVHLRTALDVIGQPSLEQRAFILTLLQMGFGQAVWPQHSPETAAPPDENLHAHQSPLDFPP